MRKNVARQFALSKTVYCVCRLKMYILKLKYVKKWIDASMYKIILPLSKSPTRLYPKTSNFTSNRIFSQNAYLSSLEGMRFYPLYLFTLFTTAFVKFTFSNFSASILELKLRQANNDVLLNFVAMSE